MTHFLRPLPPHKDRVGATGRHLRLVQVVAGAGAHAAAAQPHGAPLVDRRLGPAWDDFGVWSESRGSVLDVGCKRESWLKQYVGCFLFYAFFFWGGGRWQMVSVMQTVVLVKVILCSHGKPLWYHTRVGFQNATMRGLGQKPLGAGCVVLYSRASRLGWETKSKPADLRRTRGSERPKRFW